MSELTMHDVERFVVNKVFHDDFTMHRIQIYTTNGEQFNVRLFSGSKDITMEIGHEDYRPQANSSAL